MLALTLKHPWPYAIAELGKDVENRKWRPEPRVIGQHVALHGGARPANGKPFTDALADLQWMISKRLSPVVNLGPCVDPYLGIFAVCRFAEPVKESDSPWFFGPYAWPILDLVVLPQSIPCKGQLGLWELPDDLYLMVRSAYREARS